MSEFDLVLEFKGFDRIDLLLNFSEDLKFFESLGENAYKVKLEGELALKWVNRFYQALLLSPESGNLTAMGLKAMLPADYPASDALDFLQEWSTKVHPCKSGLHAVSACKEKKEVTMYLF